jgi:hypothetical protein
VIDLLLESMVLFLKVALGSVLWTLAGVVVVAALRGLWRR